MGEDYHRGYLCICFLWSPAPPSSHFPLVCTSPCVPSVPLHIPPSCPPPPHSFSYIDIPSVCPIYTVDPLPIDSYCICTSLFILSLPPPHWPLHSSLYHHSLNFHFFPHSAMASIQ